MYGYELVVETLAEAGVERVFGLMGDGNLGIVTAVTTHPAMQYTASRHDAGALCMAAGYAFAASRPGVATVSHGPGLSSAITSLKSAVDLRLPVVLLLVSAAKSSRKDIDHAALVALSGAGYRTVSDPSELRRGLLETMHTAVVEARAQVLDLSYAAVHGPAPDDQLAAELIEPVVAAPDARLVRCVVDELRRAQRPVLLAGIGAVNAGAIEAVGDLAALSGALLATTLRARGSFRDDAFCLGVSGGFSSSLGRDLLDGADLVVAFGASLNAWTTDRDSLYQQTRVVHVDRDPKAFGQTLPADVEVLADAGLTARAVLAEFERAPRLDPGYRTAEVRDRVSRFDRAAEFADQSDATGVDPRAALARLNRLLPADRRITTDGGHQLEWPSTLLDAAGDGSFLHSQGAGAIGQSLGTAIGATLGDPDRIGVCVVGDGSFMMGLPELDTAVRTGVRLVVIVVNDAAYGVEIHKLAELGLPGGPATFEVPDLAGIMTAMGGRALRVDRLSDLDVLDGVFDALDGPMLIDLRVTRAVVSPRVLPREAAQVGPS